VLGRLAVINFPPAVPFRPSSVRIVGIVNSLQIADPDPPAFREGPFLTNSSLLLPYRYAAADSYYVVRAASPAQVGLLMKAATSKLYAISRARVLRNVESLSTARRREYRSDRGQVIMLVAVSAVLLAMTAWGIIGLTSCWVNQRRRHIGIRRALGATRAAIVRQFQTENLLIAVGGVVGGVGLAIAANLWMISRFQTDRLDYRYVLLGAVVVLLLGQLATLWPALRAAVVPPAVAARTV
jgi:putative ABC transport system permease protein